MNLSAGTDGDPSAFHEQVQEALDTFLDAQEVRLEALGADAAALLTEARRFVRGGKRLRSSFCYWGYRALEAEPVDEAALIRACASLELLHASALVHDDVLDASDTRRGAPATHRLFESRHRDGGWRGDATAYGVAAAILLGDLMLSWADELLRRCGLAPERVESAMQVLDLCRSEVIAGQFLDVSVQARGRADVDTAMTVLRFKSAKYSVERPLHVGAALAGGDEAALHGLSGFGLPLGEAFQLRDDLLGVFGDPSVTGKPAGDDLVEGKRTVLVALALDAAPATEAARLDAGLGTALDASAVEDLRGVIERSGAAGQVEAVIEALSARAGDALAGSVAGPEARIALSRLAAAATQRAS